MQSAIRILFLEDQVNDAVLINHELRRAGLEFRTERVETKERFLQQLEHNPPDLILSDHALPGFDGLAALALARKKCPEVPFIFVTSAMGEQMTIETFERGATDYVLKERLANLAPVVRRALRETEERRKRQAIEAALAASKERFRLLVEGVVDYAIYMLDTAGRVTFWNPGAERLMGFGEQEIMGQPLARFYTAEDCQQLEPEQILKAAAAEGRVEEESWRVRKDGSRFWANTLTTALRAASGKLRGFARISRDVTERRRAEKQVRLLNQQLSRRVEERTAELKASNEQLQAFNDSVSHDLRAPLREIEGFTRLLQESAPGLSGESRAYLETILASTRQMGELIDGLLAFSRVGRAEMRTTRVSLKELVRIARRNLRRDAQGRNLAWVIHPLPEVQADPILLQQVLVNLISNALKYTRRREVARIEIGANAAGNEVIVFIRDNGVGFDMGHAEKLFNVFQRLHPTVEFEGIGIGLANVRRIVQRHGGRVWAEAAVNQGATFYFSLPTALEVMHEPKAADSAGG